MGLSEAFAHTRLRITLIQTPPLTQAVYSDFTDGRPALVLPLLCEVH